MRKKMFFDQGANDGGFYCNYDITSFAYYSPFNLCQVQDYDDNSDSSEIAEKEPTGFIDRLITSIFFIAGFMAAAYAANNQNN
jgi:hypothetical protein